MLSALSLLRRHRQWMILGHAETRFESRAATFELFAAFVGFRAIRMGCQTHLTINPTWTRTSLLVLLLLMDHKISGFSSYLMYCFFFLNISIEFCRFWSGKPRSAKYHQHTCARVFYMAGFIGCFLFPHTPPLSWKKHEMWVTRFLYKGAMR